MEIHAIWAKPTNTISIVFLVNRYILLLSILCDTYANSPGSGSFLMSVWLDTLVLTFSDAISSCTVMQHLRYACGILTVMTTSSTSISPGSVEHYLIYFASQGLFTMRVYAINEKRRWIVVVASFLVVARVGCDLWVRLYMGSHLDRISF